MTVYVDEIASYGRSATWRWNESCHLFADTVEELHEFAAGIGLKRQWFQRDKRLPHYDLTTGKRRQAVSRGAQEVTVGFVAEFMGRGDT